MRTALIAFTLASAATGPAQSQQVLSAEALLAIATPVRDFKPKDQFDTPPNPPSVAGRSFSVTLKPLPAPRGCSGFAGWEYDGKKQQFTAFAGHDILSNKVKYGPAIEIPKRQEWQSVALHYTGIACEQTTPPSYQASNAFGVKMDVSVLRNRAIAIGFATAQLYDYLKAWDRDPYYQSPAAGDVARKFSTELQVRISGTLGEWPGGRTLVCADLPGVSPTREHPVDWAQEVCAFNGQVEKIEYLDGSGAILATVNAKPTKRR